MQAMGYELIRLHTLAYRIYNPVVWDRCFNVKMLAISDLRMRRNAFVADDIIWQLYVIDKVAQKPVAGSLYTANVAAMNKQLEANVDFINAQTAGSSTIKSEGTTTDTSVSVWARISAGTYFDSKDMSIF